MTDQFAGYRHAIFYRPPVADADDAATIHDPGGNEVSLAAQTAAPGFPRSRPYLPILSRLRRATDPTHGPRAPSSRSAASVSSGLPAVVVKAHKINFFALLQASSSGCNGATVGLLSKSLTVPL